MLRNNRLVATGEAVTFFGDDFRACVIEHGTNQNFQGQLHGNGVNILQTVQQNYARRAFQQLWVFPAKQSNSMT